VTPSRTISISQQVNALIVAALIQLVRPLKPFHCDLQQLVPLCLS